MTLRGRIAIPEPLKIRVVKREKLQNLPRSAGKYSREGPRVAMHPKARNKGPNIREGQLEIP
jgi:hypothetical protein